MERASDLDWIDMPDPEAQDVERLVRRIEQLEARLASLEDGHAGNGASPAPRRRRKPPDPTPRTRKSAQTT
jgi:hypothetical protein